MTLTILMIFVIMVLTRCTIPYYIMIRYIAVCCSMLDCAIVYHITTQRGVRCGGVEKSPHPRKRRDPKRVVRPANHLKVRLK